jgi:hypothetical protein
VTARAVVGLLLAPLCLAGIAVAAVALARDTAPADWALAGVAVAAGVAAFWFLQLAARRPGLRDSPLAGSASWLWLAALVSAPFWDRLPARWELALLAAGAGYFAAVLGHLGRRVLQLRARRHDV